MFDNSGYTSRQWKNAVAVDNRQVISHADMSLSKCLHTGHWQWWGMAEVCSSDWLDQSGVGRLQYLVPPEGETACIQRKGKVVLSFLKYIVISFCKVYFVPDTYCARAVVALRELEVDVCQRCGIIAGLKLAPLFSLLIKNTNYMKRKGNAWY